MDEPLPPKGEEQFPVPPAWRPTLTALVASFVMGDFLASDVAGLDPISDQDAARNARYVEGYGDVTLTGLTEETWETSVAIWRGVGDAWDVLVDLRTEQEGRSDLCVETVVRREADGWHYRLHLIYVP